MNKSKDNSYFVKTKEAERIFQTIYRAINNRAFVVVQGDVGYGKTEIQNQLMQFWESYPDKYIVLHFPGFKLNRSRINVLMKKLIKTISPSEHVPGDVESRYDVLRNVLADAEIKRARVVLLIDNAQDLSIDTLLELKKIHELRALGRENLLSIVLFAKTSHRFGQAFETPELGHRVNRITLNAPTDAELIQIAEKRFGMQIESGKHAKTTKALFLQAAKHRPSGIKYIYKELQFAGDQGGIVTLKKLQDLFRVTFLDRLKRNNLTVNDVKIRFKQEYGKDIQKTTAYEAYNGGTRKVHDQIRDISERMINESQEEAV